MSFIFKFFGYQWHLTYVTSDTSNYTVNLWYYHWFPLSPNFSPFNSDKILSFRIASQVPTGRIRFLLTAFNHHSVQSIQAFFKPNYTPVHCNKNLHANAWIFARASEQTSRVSLSPAARLLIPTLELQSLAMTPNVPPAERILDFSCCVSRHSWGRCEVFVVLWSFGFGGGEEGDEMQQWLKKDESEIEENYFSSFYIFITKLIWSFKD